MDTHDLTQLKVANDGSGLRNALEAHYQVKSIAHVGNFVFRADREDAAPLRITTEPVDLAMQTIRIIDIQETDR